jgi:arginyl-tRNA synthetase
MSATAGARRSALPVANLLDAIGYQVQREYYVNDAGRQMNILAVSVWLRYLEHCGERFEFPSNGYRGDYVRAIGARIYAEQGAGLTSCRPPASFRACRLMKSAMPAVIWSAKAIRKRISMRWWSAPKPFWGSAAIAPSLIWA